MERIRIGDTILFIRTTYEPFAPGSAHDTKHWDHFKVIDFEPKKAEDYNDINIKTEFCGVCGSRVGTLSCDPLPGVDQRT